jgi:hypothetical protein
MRSNGTFILKLSLFVVAFIFLVGAIDTYARGRGSGGGDNRSANRNMNRSGPARTGSMKSSDFNRQSSRSSSRNVERSSNTERQANRQSSNTERQANRQGNQENRQDYHTENREDWQDYGNNARNDRQDYYDDDWDWGDNVEYPGAAAAVIAVGTALTVSAFNSQTCNPTAVSVGGVTYYQCGSNWYNQAYQEGDVVYVSVEAPPGY